MLCGDEEGNVWIYDVRHILMQQPPLPAAPQAPTQVGTAHSSLRCWGLVQCEEPRKEPSPPLSSHQILQWPQPRAQSQTVTKTMVNTVVTNPTFTYLTALTDSNIVAIWKRH